LQSDTSFFVTLTVMTNTSEIVFWIFWG